MRDSLHSVGTSILSVIDVARHRKASMTRACGRLPLLALFAMGDMSFEVDRDATVEPTLLEMAQKSTRV